MGRIRAIRHGRRRAANGIGLFAPARRGDTGARQERQAANLADTRRDERRNGRIRRGRRKRASRIGPIRMAPRRRAGRRASGIGPIRQPGKGSTLPHPPPPSWRYGPWRYGQGGWAPPSLSKGREGGRHPPVAGEGGPIGFGFGAAHPPRLGYCIPRQSKGPGRSQRKEAVMPSPAGITRLPCPSVAPGHPPHPLITLSPPFGRSAVTSHHRPHLSARMSSYPPTYCFNGATTFQSWKLETPIRGRDLRDACLLQWGHDLSAVETHL